METQNLELRIKKLEHYIQWLIVSSVLIVIFGAVALFGSLYSLRVGEMNFKTLEAERIHLVDKEGNIHVSLLHQREGAELAFYDESGRVSTSLGQFKDGSTLTFKDENYITRTSLWQVKDIHQLTLYDKRGEVIWTAP